MSVQLRFPFEPQLQQSLSRRVRFLTTDERISQVLAHEFAHKTLSAPQIGTRLIVLGTSGQFPLPECLAERTAFMRSLYLLLLTCGQRVYG